MVDIFDKQSRQTLLEATLDALPDAALVLDASGGLRYRNQAAARRWDGLSEGAPLAGHPTCRHVYDAAGRHVPPSDLPFAQTLRDGTARQNIALTLRLPGEAPRAIRLTATPLPDGDRLAGVVVLIAEDATAAPAPAAAGALGQAQLAEILDRLPIGVYVAEGEADQRTIRWTLMNRAAREQLPADASTPTGPITSAYRLLHPDGRPYATQDVPIVRILWGDEPAASGEALVRYADGSERYVATEVVLLEERAGTRVALFTLRDITSQRHLEAEVLRQTEARRTHYERLGAIVDRVDIGLAVLDRTGRLELVNEAWLRLTGRRRADVLGRLLAAASGTALAAQGRALLESALADGEPRIMRSFLVPGTDPSDGRYMDASILPIRDPDGTITGALATLVDVSAAVQAGRQLETHRALLETIYDTAPVGLAFLDRDLRFVALNQEYANFTGRAPEAIRGRTMYELRPEAAAHRAAHERALAGEPAELHDLALQHGEEPAHYYDVRFQPVRDAAGAVIGVVTAAVDVTARYLAEQQKDAFLALAAHELRTPLTVIKGYAQLGLRLGAPPRDPHVERALNRINQQTEWLTALIAGLLDISPIAAGRLELQPAALDLASLVSEAVADLAQVMPEFALTTAVPETAVPVRADSVRLRQVVSHLLQNAVRYSGTSRRVDITLGVIQSGPGGRAGARRGWRCATTASASPAGRRRRSSRATSAAATCPRTGTPGLGSASSSVRPL